MSPILLFFFMAIIEYGYAAGAYLSVNAATAEGLRVASVMGKSSNADWEIIQGIEASLGGRDDVGVEKIVIFKAQFANSAAPVGCTAGTGRVTVRLTTTLAGKTVAANGACNGYSGATDFNLPASAAHFYRCGSPSYPAGDNRSRGYCPDERTVSFPSTTTGGNSSGPDYIGVYVRYKHKMVTGFFADDITFEMTSITKLEPTEVSA
jgi:hypothetical protein